MDRSQKVATVEELSLRFRESPHFMMTGFFGLSVAQATELRRRIRAAGGTYRVIKNRLAKLAAAGTPAEPLVDLLGGPRAIAFHESDPVTLAKTLFEFAKENPAIQLLAGVVDAREVLDAEGIKALAVLPALPELRAQLLSLIQTPAGMLVRLLHTPGSHLARVMDARREQLESGGADGGSVS